MEKQIRRIGIIGSTGSIGTQTLEIVRTNNGQPAFYNEKVIMEGLKNKFPFIKPKSVASASDFFNRFAA